MIVFIIWSLTAIFIIYSIGKAYRLGKEDGILIGEDKGLEAGKKLYGQKKMHCDLQHVMKSVIDGWLCKDCKFLRPFSTRTEFRKHRSDFHLKKVKKTTKKK